MKITLKSNIEELVLKSGLRKGYLAEKLEITSSQFRKYETGTSLIPMDKAHILAKLLNVKVDDLYDIQDNDCSEL